MLSVPFVIGGIPVILDRSRVLPVYLYTTGSQVDGDGRIIPTDPDYKLDLTDPCYQNNTSYQPVLDPDVDLFGVLPPQMFLAVEEEVMGCQYEALNVTTGNWSAGVIGDSGPVDKLGENSIAMNKALGVPWSPTTGGVSDHIIFYRVFPGVPGVANGRTYQLQKYRI